MHADHNHPHGHGSQSEQPHEHSHAHAHDHCYSEPPGAPPKDLALLKYMLEHNKQHAHELSEVGGRLAGAGLAEAAALIGEAAHYFDHANDKLEKAILLCRGA